MQTVKILFKSIDLSKEEKESVTDFFVKYNSLDFHYYVIFDEKEHMNCVHCDINIWIVDKYEECESDNYHCVIRFYKLKELFEEFKTLIEEISVVFSIKEEDTVNIKQGLLNNTNTKKYNIDRRGKGELDINYKANSVEEDNDKIERRLRGHEKVISLNPYKDLFK